MENDLISRSELKSFLCKCCNVLHSDEPCEPSECNVMGWVDELPAVDAVLVVRCKDCVERTVTGRCNCITGRNIYVQVGDDFFCSYGERRDNNG